MKAYTHSVHRLGLLQLQFDHLSNSQNALKRQSLFVFLPKPNHIDHVLPKFWPYSRLVE